VPAMWPSVTGLHGQGPAGVDVAAGPAHSPSTSGPAPPAARALLHKRIAPACRIGHSTPGPGAGGAATLPAPFCFSSPAPCPDYYRCPQPRRGPHNGFVRAGGQGPARRVGTPAGPGSNFSPPPARALLQLPQPPVSRAGDLPSGGGAGAWGDT